MANRKPPEQAVIVNPAPQAEVRQPTFDLNDPVFQAIVAQAVAVALAAKQADKPAKSDQSAKNAWAAKKAFAKKGFKDAEPGVNILTYNRWIAAGYRVKPGEHAVKVANLRLFHVSQVEKLDPKEHKEALGKLEAKRASKSAQVIPIGNQPQA